MTFFTTCLWNEGKYSSHPLDKAGVACLWFCLPGKGKRQTISSSDFVPYTMVLSLSLINICQIKVAKDVFWLRGSCFLLLGLYRSDIVLGWRCIVESHHPTCRNAHVSVLPLQLFNDSSQAEAAASKDGGNRNSFLTFHENIKYFQNVVWSRSMFLSFWDSIHGIHVLLGDPTGVRANLLFVT